MHLLALTTVLLLSLASHAQKYKRVDLKNDKESHVVESGPSKAETEITAAVIEALGTDIIFKSASRRVLSININSSMIEINYLTSPALLGPRNVTKDGIFIDALRVVEELVKTKSVKSSTAKTLLLRPYVITSIDKSIEVVSKIEVNLNTLKKTKLGSLDGAAFEKWTRRNGKVSYAPYLINNGGKFLILKPEFLDL